CHSLPGFVRLVRQNRALSYDLRRIAQAGGPVCCEVMTNVLYGLSRLALDRKSTRLNSSHLVISYAAFCLKTKNRTRFVHALRRHECLTPDPLVLVAADATHFSYLRRGCVERELTFSPPRAYLQCPINPHP